MSTADPQIEDFLSRVRELDVDRIREDNFRRKKLEDEIAAKKKRLGSEGAARKSPLVPAKSAHLAKLNLLNSTKSNDIQLINVRAREEPETDPSVPSKLVQQPKPFKSSYTEANKTAKEKYMPIVSLEDTLAQPKRTDLVYKSSLATPPSSSSSSLRSNIPMPKPIHAVSASAAAKAPQMMRPTSSIPVEETKTSYIPMPKPIAAISASAAAKAPQLMRTVDRRAVEETTTTSNYIPLPKPVAAMSASAAARAPQLMRTVNRLDEREPGLEKIAKYLTQPGEHPLPKPVASKTNAKKAIAPKKADLPARVPGTDVIEALEATSRLRSPSPVYKEKKTEPEALMKLGGLRKASPVRKDSATKPEAVMKLGRLKPAVPAKKPAVKLPDAVVRANQMKKGEMTKPAPKLSDFERSKEDLLRNSLLGLRKSKTTTTREARPPLPDRTMSFPNVMPQMVRLPFMDPNAAPPALKTAPAKKRVMEKNTAPQKLTHTTKARAKGPRRRLPTSITNTPETPGTTTPNTPQTPVKIVVKPKKVPPPIRSSSRKVSTSEIFL